MGRGLHFMGADLARVSEVLRRATPPQDDRFFLLDILCVQMNVINELAPCFQ